MQQSNIQVKAEIICNQCIVTLKVKLNLEEVTEEKRLNHDKPRNHDLRKQKKINHERNQYDTT